MEDRCVVCGEIIPEGRMVCPMCEEKWNKSIEQYDYEYETNKPVGIPIVITLLVSLVLDAVIAGFILLQIGKLL